MPLAPIRRVVFTKNPLANVIAQVRFPAILTIDTQLPAKFQETLRHRFPIFRQVNEVHAIPAGLPPDVQRVMRSFAPAVSKQYVFESSDDVWSVTLSRESLSLGCKRYERWEEFRAQFLLPLDELIKIYGPAFFSRVGLRYQNVILRSKLGLSQVPWAELLRSHIAAELGSPDIASTEIDSNLHKFVLKLPGESGKVTVQHGTGHMIAVNPGESNEDVYVIDNDFFTEGRTEITNAPNALDHFNSQSGRLFRWCITPRLELAMGEHPIS